MNIAVGCEPARDWLESQPDAQTAWDACENPQWMLWWCRHCEVDDRTMRMLAVGFARSVAHLMTDERSWNAIEVAERHANGLATDEELAAAARAADAAYAIARVTYAATNAYCAAYCAARAACTVAAYAAAYCADYAADCADCTVAAAYAADARAQCAMIRAAIPTVPNELLKRTTSRSTTTVKPKEDGR